MYSITNTKMKHIKHFAAMSFVTIGFFAINATFLFILIKALGLRFGA